MTQCGNVRIVSIETGAELVTGRIGKQVREGDFVEFEQRGDTLRVRQHGA